MDTLTPEQRHLNMSRIKGKNTRPEKRVRSLLHGLGYRFRLNVKSLPGKPDIVLPKYKTAIFVHGCFWHRHEACCYTTTPKTRQEFWEKKFSDNIQRDKNTAKSLEQLGWTVLVVWECELKDMEMLRHRLLEALPKYVQSSSSGNARSTSPSN